MNFIPSYKNIDIEEFNRKGRLADTILQSCKSCPRNCKIDRTNGELGICASGSLPIVSSYTPHFGEEPVLSGTKGAGNIFFGNCNLNCVYCQNFIISQKPKIEKKNEVTIERLADIMLELQEKGCHNIGLVSPTHYSASIIKSIKIAVERGLNLPIIYNTNGYDSVEVLSLYDGIINIYLPDFKYGDNTEGKIYSKVDDYFDRTKEAITEMYRQVGSELIYENGNVVKGLIIRHLILPNGLADTEKVFKFISELDPKIHVSLMAQYYPANIANRYMLINRSVSNTEYSRAIELLDKFGLENGWIQELESSESYRPYFDKNRTDPFNNDRLKR